MATIKLLQDCYMTESWTIRRSGERFERNVQPSIRICTALKALYYLKWFVLRWMIYTTLNDMYYVEWFVLRWKTWTTLSDLRSVELFAYSWIICSTALNDLSVIRWMSFTLNDLYYVEWFVLRCMIFYFVAKFLPPQMTWTAKEFTALKDLYYVEWLGVWWMICTTLNHLDYD